MDSPNEEPEHPRRAPQGDPLDRQPLTGDPLDKQPPRVVVLTTRYLLPIVILVIGILFIIAGHGRYKSVFANRDSLYSAIGVSLILVSGSIVLLGWLMRMNSESFLDRDKEERAREYFIRTGHWPDER